MHIKILKKIITSGLLFLIISGSVQAQTYLNYNQSSQTPYSGLVPLSENDEDVGLFEYNQSNNQNELNNQNQYPNQNNIILLEKQKISIIEKMFFEREEN